MMRSALFFASVLVSFAAAAQVTVEIPSAAKKDLLAANDAASCDAAKSAAIVGCYRTYGVPNDQNLCEGKVETLWQQCRAKSRGKPKPHTQRKPKPPQGGADPPADGGTGTEPEVVDPPAECECESTTIIKKLEPPPTPLHLKPVPWWASLGVWLTLIVWLLKNSWDIRALRTAGRSPEVAVHRRTSAPGETDKTDIVRVRGQKAVNTEIVERDQVFREDE